MRHRDSRFSHITLILTVAVASSGLTACGGGGGGDGDSAGQPGISERSVFVNPDDSAIYRLGTTDGQSVTYLGERDADGVPTGLSMIEYDDADGQRFDIFLDRFALPVAGADQSGNVIRLQYLDENGQPVSPGNSQPGTASRRFNQNGSGDSTRRIGSVGVSIVSNGSGNARAFQGNVNLDTPVIVDLDETLAQARAVDPVGNLDIDISKCDIPVDPSGGVVVNYANANSARNGLYPAFATSQPGRFVARLPVRQPFSIPDRLEEACSAFSDAVGFACSVFNFDPAVTGSRAANAFTDPAFQTAFCAQVSLIASANPAAPITGPAAGSLCLATLVGGTFACNTLNQSFSPAPDAPSVLARLCDVEGAIQALDSAEGFDRASIQAIADFQSGAAISTPGSAPRGIAVSQQRDVNAAGPFPPLLINDFTPSVDSFGTTPANPMVGAPYSASAELSCVQGADITLTAERGGSTVAGDIVASNSNRNSISVQVPAAPNGDTVDILTVGAANQATADSVSQQRSVVFEAEEDSEAPPGGFDFRSVTRARYELVVEADGTFEPTDVNEDPVAQTRTVDSDRAFPPINPDFGNPPCPRQDLGSQQNNEAFGFAFQTENATPEQPGGTILVQIDPQTCMTATTISLFFDNANGRRISTRLQGAAIQADVINDETIRYQITGPALCNAIVDFEFQQEEAGGRFDSETPQCNASSGLRVTLSH